MLAKKIEEFSMLINIKRNLLFLSIGVFFLLAFCAVQVWAGPGPLVSTDWLARNMNKPGIVILDVRTFPQHEKSHIPGAANAFGPWMTMNDQFVGFMMPKVQNLVELLRVCGVNGDSFVVVYDQGITAQDTTRSARALWTLHVLGHDKVAILDGGFAAWEQAEKPVTKKPASPKRGNFIARPMWNKLATLADVKSKIGSSWVVFVDTRLPEEHFGHEKKSHIRRYGHFPGSRLMPASFFTNAGIDLSPSFLKKKDELTMMAEGVGIPADKNVEIITYSNHGQSAAMGYFVLHDILGYRNVRVFDGSILEAAADKKTPMERYSWGYKTR